MVKKAIRNMLEAMNIEVSLKKNLWYIDAFEVQKRIVTKERPVIVDVGASEGSVVNKYKSIYPGAAIHAFEPQPDSFQKLKEMSSKIQGVYCNNLALSDIRGESIFYKTNSSPSSSLLTPARSGSFIDDHTEVTEKFAVRLDTLDNYAASQAIENIDILKMDVQGNELNVLKGSTRLLKEGAIELIYTEVWFTSAYEQQPFYEDIALYLRELQYYPFGLYNMHWDLKLNGKNLWADAIFTKNK